MGLINSQLLLIWDYITGAELWVVIGTRFLKIMLIVIMAIIVVRLGRRIIERIFSDNNRISLRITARREDTLKILMKNILGYVVYFVTFIMILEALTLPISSILAGAGVLGIAVGFGAKNLVQDIIAGFFIIFEDQFSVGDYIVTSGVEGVVEEIGLRTIKIKSWTGEQNIIMNGSVDKVTNYSIHNGIAIVDINIPYENDIVLAEKIIEDIMEGIPDKYEEFVSKPVIHGVQTLDLSHFVIRVIAETLPVFQWSGARAIRKEVKEHLYKEGIDIPSPRLVIYSKNEHKDK